MCVVHEDNEAYLNFVTMPNISPRFKHTVILHHFFRTQVENLEIKIGSINTKNKLADQFKKGLPQYKFVKVHKVLMGW